MQQRRAAIWRFYTQSTLPKLALDIGDTELVVDPGDNTMQVRFRRMYADDPNVGAEIEIYSVLEHRGSGDGTPRGYLLLGLLPSTNEAGECVAPPHRGVIDIVLFQSQSPADGYNGHVGTALIEVLKMHHAALLERPQGPPGDSWTQRAYAALEQAGNLLRQRLRWRRSTGEFAKRSGTKRRYDMTGTPDALWEHIERCHAEGRPVTMTSPHR